MKGRIIKFVNLGQPEITIQLNRVPEGFLIPLDKEVEIKVIDND